MRIVPASSEHLEQWSRLRVALWDLETVETHEAEELYLQGNPNRTAFVAFDDAGTMIGFAEAALRHDYVEGCDTSPVAYLEGVYVVPEARKTGVARALSDSVADWGRARGCSEYASDALLDNIDSHNFHAAIGFAETERVVYFRKELT